MNFILILKELWRRRIFVAGAAVVAVLVAVLAVYDVSFAPPSLSKRDHSEARGSVELLVDSSKSPIGDVGRDLEPLTARAGVFARYILGGSAVAQMAEDTGIPIKQIEVAGPAPLPGEAAGVTAPSSQELPYGIEVVQRDELPILNIGTRAPTVPEARELAAAAPAAVRHIVTEIQEQQGIPEGKRVTFRVLGPAQANVDEEALGAKVAVLIFIALFLFLLTLILAIPRLIAAWKAVDAEPWQPGEPQHSQPRVVMPLPPGRSSDPSGARALASASIAAAEEIVERAQLETSNGEAAHGGLANGVAEHGATRFGSHRGA